MRQLAFIILDKEDRGTHKERHAMKRGSVVVEHLGTNKSLYMRMKESRYRVLKSNKDDMPVGSIIKTEFEVEHE